MFPCEGDANLDSSTNIQDIVLIVNHIVSGLELIGDAFDNSDVNNDDTIDVIEVEHPQYTIEKYGEGVLVKSFGEIDITYRTEALKITHTSPDGISDIHSIQTTTDGYYEIYFQHGWDSPMGTYLISTARNSVEIGTTSYDLIQDQLYQSTEEIMAEYNKEDSKESNITRSISNNDVIPSKIPNWVKTVFGWYYLDKISEGQVISAIEYLVTKNIIKLD